MAGKISTSAKREITLALAERYRTSGQLEKERILDELCAVTDGIVSTRSEHCGDSAVPRRRAGPTELPFALHLLCYGTPLTGSAVGGSSR